VSTTTGLTFSAGTSSIAIADTGAVAKSFLGGSKVYETVVVG
jgi:hypothetical protein